MGFIIWYKLEFKDTDQDVGALSQLANVLSLGPTFPLLVSNDVFNGKYILDAYITVRMTPAETVDIFTIKLTNLPTDVASELKKKQSEGLKASKPLLVDIYLGYFDELLTNKPTLVMKGAVLSVKSTVNQNGLLETVVEGQEIGGYKLRTKCNSYDSKEIAANDLLKQIAKDANVHLTSDSTLDPALKLTNFTSKQQNGLAALRELADRARVPLVIRDGTIYIGPAVGKEQAPIFDPDRNIVRQDELEDIEEVDEPCDKRLDGKVKTNTTIRFKLTVLGDPRLRVGQTAELKDPPTQNLRIMEVTHTFSTSSGYTCDVNLVQVEAGKKIGEKMTGAHGVVRRVRDVVENVQNQRQAIDVGEVQDYEEGSQKKHLATLKYGQSPPPENVAPSVEVEVNKTPLLHSKPIVSPFAWHKCGLIVPVYPGMRALLAHNLGLTNDAVVAGFLWSENPTYDRPKNEQGDYWLCLPTKIDESTKQPTGKGVNDLTDRAGLRVIQARGLQIFVGDDALPQVGERPAVPKAKTIVIEHESGTKITIADNGSLTIETNNKDISITNGKATLTMGGNSGEISLHNDKVTLKLGQSGVEVS